LSGKEWHFCKTIYWVYQKYLAQNLKKLFEQVFKK
jgi:hypothetical protein